MPEDILEEKELKEAKKCDRCKKVVFAESDYYCRHCGSKLIILPPKVEYIDRKEEFEKMHFENFKRDHEEMSKIMLFSYCPICGVNLLEKGPKESE